MLIDILNRFCEDTGYNPVSQRAIALTILRNAAKQLYDVMECNRIYREVTLVVPRNKVVSLPSSVGDLRGMRAHTADYPFDLHSMSSPRYVSSLFGYKRNNWRDLGLSVVHTLPAQVGQLTFETAVVESASILISGETSNAARLEETLILNASPKSSVNSYTVNLFAIACKGERTANIVVKDADSNEIAVLYNTDEETRYRLADVSEVFWSVDTSNDETLVDVLYKNPLGKLLKDADQFPAGSDYDDAWYNMAMHLFYSPMENRGDDSTRHRGLALAAATSTKNGVEQNEVKKVSFGRNKFYNHQRRNSILYPTSNSPLY